MTLLFQPVALPIRSYVSKPAFILVRLRLLVDVETMPKLSH